MTALALWYGRLLSGCALLAGLLFGGMALWVSYDVLARYFLARPTSWALDLSEYAMLWAVFLAAPWVLRQGAHVCIDIFVERLGAPARRWMAVATALIGAFVCAILAWQGILECRDLYARGLDFGREWKVHQWQVYLAIPVGASLLAVECLVAAARTLRQGARAAAAPRTDSGLF